VRFGLIGDIHAEDERLAAALALFERERAAEVLFVGDVADGLGDLNRCCALLSDARAIGVRGNHDRWLLEDTMRSLPNAKTRDDLTPSALAFLESLPAVRDIDTPLGLLLLCHGVGESDMRRLSAEDAGYALETQDELASVLEAHRHAIVVGGHTHARMVRRFRASDLRRAGDASLVFVNAGTLARDHTPCCALLDCKASVVTFFDLEEPSTPRAGESFALP
jgi:predicted phosphodiesterase